jgi:peptidoglycan/LPS O-acetylase OafA/YrhL
MTTEQCDPEQENDDQELVLLPPECPSREQLEQQFASPLRLEPEVRPPRWQQFSISDMMILMVGVAVGLSGGSWLPTDVFAAALGIVTLTCLLVVNFHPPETHLAKLLWGTLVLAYVLAVVAALLRPPTGIGV